VQKEALFSVVIGAKTPLIMGIVGGRRQRLAELSKGLERHSSIGGSSALRDREEGEIVASLYLSLASHEALRMNSVIRAVLWHFQDLDENVVELLS
jgi:hypothetical protein